MFKNTLTLVGISSLMLVTLASCNGDGDDVDDTGDPGAGCGITAENTVPGSGASDAYYRGTVEFKLSGQDPEMEPTITLEGPNGAVSGEVTGTDGRLIVFTPDAPLSPQTSYTATLSYCGGDPSVEFSTGELGNDLESDIIGNTYVVDLGSARFVEPESLGAMLGALGDMPDVLMGVMDVTTEIEMMGALAVEGSSPPEQDYCNPTFAFPPADFSDSPFFQVGPADTNLAVAGYELMVRDLEISGTYAPDGSYFGGGVLAGLIDARDIAEMFEQFENAEDLCELAASFGAPCIECNDGVETCLKLRAVDILADLHPAGLVLEEVELQDCHELCDDESGCPGPR